MNKLWIIGIAVVVIGGVGWYGLSPLFNTLQTDEPVPVESEAMMKKDGGVEASSAIEQAGDAMMKEKSDAMMQKELMGTIVGTAGHPASGTVRIVHANGKDYIRYENLKTINGPDIYVYLSKDLGAEDFVEIGKVKSTEGNSNYEIPAGTNVQDYKYVLIWCKQFGVLFNSAELK